MAQQNPGSVIIEMCRGCRRQVTFLASPRKVTKRRRPEVRCPAKAPGALPYSKRQAAAELGLEGLPRERFRLCLPSDSPRGMPLSFLRYSAILIGARSHFRHHRARHRQFAFCDCKNLVSFVPRKRPRLYMVVEVRLGPHERSRAAATNLGSPFFGHFLWRSKESD